MPRVLLCSAAILFAILVTGVSCQEEESGDTFWTKLMNRVKTLCDDIRKIWNELKDEFKARSTDMKEWSTETWARFKETLFKRINSENISDEERKELEEEIEKLQMPETLTKP